MNALSYDEAQKLVERALLDDTATLTYPSHAPREAEQKDREAIALVREKGIPELERLARKSKATTEAEKEHFGLVVKRWNALVRDLTTALSFACKTRNSTTAR